MGEHHYTCDGCGESFTSDRDPAEAEAESKRLFGTLAPEERAQICDVCFKAFMKWLKGRGWTPPH